MSLKHFLSIAFAGQPVFLKPSWIQGIPLRSIFMNAVLHHLVGNEKRPLRLMEVGSWMGSSCLTWAQSLHSHNNGVGEIICVDPLVPFFDVDHMKSAIDTADSGVKESQYELLDEMDGLLRGDYVYDLLMHNISIVPKPTEIKVVRDFAAKVMPGFDGASFDLVYIDGSHVYDDALIDIKNGMRLVKDGGILCGDDLELQANQIDLEFAKNNCDKDFPTDPKTKTQFHPGVTLAVSECLGEVSNFYGFWAMQRCGNSFIPVELTSFPAQIPIHFPPSLREFVVKQLRDLNIIR